MERFVETIKVLDGQFCNLEAHERRARRTVEAIWGKSLAWEVGKMIIPVEMCSGLVKCRVVYDWEVREVSFQPYVMRQIRSLRLVDGDKVDYRYKSTDRSMFIRLMEQRGECDDVLIVRDGWVTDTSFTNVVFEDVVGGLYTPDTYLLEGTRRQSLLDVGKIQACPIRVEDIGHFQRVLLVNAMIGLEDEISVPVVNIMK